jgi:hypothetical protein
MKKNTETLWTGLKLRKSQASVPKMFSLPIFFLKSEKYSAASQWTASSGR